MHPSLSIFFVCPPGDLWFFSLFPPRDLHKNILKEVPKSPSVAIAFSSGDCEFGDCERCVVGHPGKRPRASERDGRRTGVPAPAFKTWELRVESRRKPKQNQGRSRTKKIAAHLPVD